MKNLIRLSAIAAVALSCQLVSAQAAPAAVVKPAGATGQCKDGSYSTAATKAGACRGHSGVKEWYAAPTITGTAKATPATTPAATPAAAATPVKPATPQTPSPTTQAKTQTQSAAQAASQSTTPPATTSIQKPAATALPTTPAAGGGPGMVWVNTASNVYHCPGTKYYGKTKAGTYMSEADAKNKGIRADHGNACTK